MKITQNFLLVLFTTSLFFFSCTNNKSSHLLTEVENVLEQDPSKALTLLESVENPMAMDKNDYMKYILWNTVAKKETQIDISGDTLIYETVDYFKNKKDYKNFTLANYYAGWVHYLNDEPAQSLESFMQAAYCGQETNNNLIVANSFNHIGYIYFEQNLFDSTIVNCQKAMRLFDKLENVDSRKLISLTNIGLAYEAIQKKDSAIFYFDKCLSLAEKIDNKTYQFHSLLNKSVVYYNEKNYSKAIESFQTTLSLKDSINQLNKLKYYKIHVALLHIYNELKDFTSAKKYADLVITNIPDTTDPYTLKEMYLALGNFFEKTGDYKQALEYRNYEKEASLQIEKELNSEAILKADKNFYLNQKEYESAQYRSKIYYILTISAAVLIVAILFIIFVWRDRKKGIEEIKSSVEKYDELKDILLGMGSEYPAIEKEIKSMLEDDEDEKIK